MKWTCLFYCLTSIKMSRNYFSFDNNRDKKIILIWKALKARFLTECQRERIIVPLDRCPGHLKFTYPRRPGRRRGRRAGEINTSQLLGQTTPAPWSTPAPGQMTPAHSSSPAPLSTPAAPGQTTKRQSRGTIIPREGVIIEWPLTGQFHDRRDVILTSRMAVSNNRNVTITENHDLEMTVSENHDWNS